MPLYCTWELTCVGFCFGDATAFKRHASGRFEFGNNEKTIEYRFF